MYINKGSLSPRIQAKDPMPLSRNFNAGSVAGKK